MYERAKYYRGRFIRNAIAGFAISAFVLFNAIGKDNSITFPAIIFPLAACAWLYFGLRIKEKLKTKAATVEITDERIPFKQVEYVFSILVFVSLFLAIRQTQYANYLVTVVLIAYTAWFSVQMKMLNDYFKAV
jgi:hypothetical protein